MLRRPLIADAPAIHACCSDPEVVHYMDWPLQSDFQKTVERISGAAAAWNSADEYQWIIAATDDSEVHGTIACRIRDHAVDFGYFTARSSWGKGIAHEACALLIEWLMKQPGIYRIWATVDVENQRSIRLLERLGLQREGIMRMATYRPNIGGLPRDTLIMARITMNY